MARLVVLANESLGDGFRLARPETIVARPGVAAATDLRRLIAAGDTGLVLVTADLWASVDERLRALAERTARPIVLPIPAGVVTDFTTRRQLLDEMLQRAIGYRIQLAGAGR